MPDDTTGRAPSPGGGGRPSGGWDEAFARLPGETPPVDAWRRFAASLDAGGRTRSATPGMNRRAVGGWLALAAVLALVAVVPWQPMPAPDAVPSGTIDPGAPRTTPTLAQLHAESALLETLLAHARDGRVASGSAAAMTADLEARLAAIDAALARPGLAPASERALWAERVQALRALASFEGTRRWLAANGEQYDGVLVQVN